MARTATRPMEKTGEAWVQRMKADGEVLARREKVRLLRVLGYCPFSTVADARCGVVKQSERRGYSGIRTRATATLQPILRAGSNETAETTTGETEETARRTPEAVVVVQHG